MLATRGVVQAARCIRSVSSALSSSHPMRLARAIAAAGVASRRAAERLIVDGCVSVNGSRESSPAVNVDAALDKIVVSGKLLPPPRVSEVYLVHKLRGELVTQDCTDARPTLFARLSLMGLPPNLKKIGRLDFQSSGLQLVTTDGQLARFMELPANGELLVREYRVKVYGRHIQRAIDAMRAGVVLEGTRYKPADVRVLGERLKQTDALLKNSADTSKVSWHDRRLQAAQRERDDVGASASGAALSGPMPRVRDSDLPPADTCWLRIRLTEGKNREIRRIFEHFGVAVNDLVRTAYGPFLLTNIPRGGAVKVPTPRWLCEAAARASRGKLKGQPDAASSAAHNDSELLPD